MMKIYGIIAEFNPFHNGHEYIVRKMRDSDENCGIVCVMSGNVVQRGDFAIFDKFARTKMSLCCGVDLVIELPSPYVLSSAEFFARGAVSILDSLGCIDGLFFGSECGSADLLIQAVEMASSEMVEQRIRNNLKLGLSYVKAHAVAVSELLPENTAKIFDSPNNILGTQYIKALKSLRSRIEPIAFRRVSVDHDSFYASDNFASASHIRRLISAGSFTEILRFIPKSCQSIVEGMKKSDIHSILFLERAIIADMRKKAVSDFLHDFEVHPQDGLANRIEAAVKEARTLEELYFKIKSKRTTLAFIRRVIMRLYLGIDESFYRILPPYVRVLGATDRGLEILSKAKSTATLPVSHSLKKLQAISGCCADFAKLEAGVSDVHAVSAGDVNSCCSDYNRRFIRL